MAVANFQITLQPNTATLLVYVGSAAKAYFSWPASQFGLMYFGGSGLTSSNGLAVTSATAFEPFIVDVPAFNQLYALNADTNPKTITMMVIY